MRGLVFWCVNGSVIGCVSESLGDRLRYLVSEWLKCWVKGWIRASEVLVILVKILRKNLVEGPVWRKI